MEKFAEKISEILERVPRDQTQLLYFLQMVARIQRFIRANIFLVVLALISAIGAFLRFYNLGASSLYHDEALYWQWAVSLSNGESLNPLIDTNVYLFLLKSIVPISQSEFSLRFFSALPGALSIPAFYFLTRRMIDPVGALAAAGLLALSPSLIVVAQTVREHTLFLFLIILVVFFFHSYLKERKTSHLALFSLFSILAIFTHISAAWVILALGLTYLFFFALQSGPRDYKQLFGFAIYGAFIFTAGVLFWLNGFSNFAGHGLEGYTEYGYYWDGTLGSFFGLLGNIGQLLEWATSERAVGLVATGLALALYFEFRAKKRRMDLLLISLLPLMITIVTGLLSFYPFIGGHRNNIYLVLGVFSLAGLGFSYAVKESKAISFFVAGLTAFFLIASSWAGIHQPSLEEMKPVAERLCDSVSAEDKLYVFAGSQPTFEYYWSSCPIGKTIPITYIAEGQIETNLLYNGEDVWLVLSHLKEGERGRLLFEVEQAFDREFKLIFEANGAWLYLIRN